MTDTSHNILKRLGSTSFPGGLQQIAGDAGEHIQAQAETIKALVEALEFITNCYEWGASASGKDLAILDARAALVTAKETT